MEWLFSSPPCHSQSLVLSISRRVLQWAYPLHYLRCMHVLKPKQTSLRLILRQEHQRLPETTLQATDATTMAATFSSSARTIIFVVTPDLEEYAILMLATTRPPLTVLPKSLS
jgi:hypothetical protein